MSTTIIINGQSIQFPTSGTSPDWAPAIVQFAQAVEAALNTAVGQFDIPPSTYDISAFNPTGSPTNIPGLAFSSTAVRGAYIRIAVGRTTSSASAFEITNINCLYQPNNSPGSLWQLSQDTLGNGQISFTMTDTGQLQFQTATLSGTGHNGVITFSATAMQV